MSIEDITSDDEGWQSLSDEDYEDESESESLSEEKEDEDSHERSRKRFRSSQNTNGMKPSQHQQLSTQSPPQSLDLDGQLSEHRAVNAPEIKSVYETSNSQSESLWTTTRTSPTNGSGLSSSSGLTTKPIQSPAPITDKSSKQ